MLIEFRVKNFRSIREEQIFSLVASKDDQNEETRIIDSQPSALPRLLRSAVIYGANASGKSNLINAIDFMRSMVAASAQIQPGQALNHYPFKLDPVTAIQPSEFEVTFSIDGIRYQYGFQSSAERIVEEWLYVYKTAKPQTWFYRKFDSISNSDEYEFSSFLTGKRKLWQATTRSNTLFLSVAVHLNSELLSPVFLWLIQDLLVIGANLQPVNNKTVELIQSADGKKRVIDLMNAADLSILDLSSESVTADQFNLHIDGEKATPSVTKVEFARVKFHHMGESGTAVFELSDESTGTQRFFAFAGTILDILENARVLVVDEFEGSFHPLLARYLINLFHSKETNPNNAQLIISTHNTGLLDSDVFRRDQIWFMEKNAHMASSLFSLSEISARKNESFERNYLSGQYGALPFIENLE